MKYIACFGDSLIQGFPYMNDSSWIAEVENRTNIKMLNYGVCGECCDDIYYRLRMTMLPEATKHILFLGGANDIIQGRPQKCILEDMAKLLKWCEQKNYKLCIVLPLISAEPVLNKYLVALGEKIKEQFADKALLLDLQPAIGLTDEEREDAYLDGVHPKAITYKLMGVYAAPILEAWVKEK